MNPDFEIKYIEVQWYNREIITKITESLTVLPLEYNTETRCFESETTIYPNADGLRGQLAVRMLNNKVSNPYIKTSTGEKKHLTSIKDVDTGKTWWIFKFSWDEINKTWNHISINTVGTLKLVVADQECHVLISAIDFTRKQLDYYLASFKDDLWELILDDSSITQVDRENNSFGINESTIKYINNLIFHAEKILANPKVELRSVQAIKPRKAVKPVNRTFMELVSKVDQRLLTSRATTPTYNVAENRYVLFALERCYRIIKQITILSRNKMQRYANTVDKLKNQYKLFNNKIKIDRDLVVKDLEFLRERCYIEYWKELLSKKMQQEEVKLVNKKDYHQEIYIFTENFTKNKDGFFICVFKSGEWSKENEKATIFSCKKLTSLIKYLMLDTAYSIVGKISRHETDKAVIYTPEEISYINIEYTELTEKAKNKFKREKDIGFYLAENNWERSLNEKELEEQEKEKIALLNRINFYLNNKELSKEIFEKVEPKQKKILKIINQLKEKGVISDSYFPNSMTFVQNPHYQGVYNTYKALRNMANLADDNLLMSLEKIDSIDIVNMPLLYERWCLMQIIKVLKESFKFTAIEDWKYKLISAIEGNQYNTEILFSNKNTGRNIIMTYEKILENGKRPDFVIDLNWSCNGEQGKKRFILDAKFYGQSTFERKGGGLAVILDLYNNKKYCESIEDPNPVFILHPCRTTIKKPVTPQKWGKHSFLGELAMDSDSPNHQYGSVSSPYTQPIFC